MSSKTKGSLKKRIIIGIAIFLALVLIVMGTGVAVIYHYINKINIDTPGGNLNVDVTSNGSEIVSVPDEVDSYIDSNVSDATESEIDEIESQIQQVQKQELLKSKDVINILLIGTDGREVTERGRSDSMMLVSLNKITKKIYITSIMRDTYVNIPGALSNRINAAYSRGGAKLLMQTIEDNFRIGVDKYVRVNFQSFELLIDYFGGIEITVSDKEAERIPGLETGGTYILNGEQALVYSRIRHVGQGDFERTERQRTVLTELIEKCNQLSIFELGEVLDFVLPNVVTNMTKDEIFGHVLMSPTYSKYEIVNQRVPCDGSWSYTRIRGMSVLKVNFSKNIDFFKKTVYSGVY